MTQSTTTPSLDSPDVTGAVERVNEMLCPECGEDTPSTEAFEVFGLALCAECAADLFDPGDGFPDETRTVLQQQEK